MRVREVNKLEPPRYYLVMRRVGTKETAHIEITPEEHELEYQACENKVRAEGRFPPGQWESNAGGDACRLGGVEEYDTQSKNMEPGDVHIDNRRILLNAGGVLLDLEPRAWNVRRNPRGELTIRDKQNREPASFSIEDGEMTVKDLGRVVEDIAREDGGRQR